MKVLFIVSFPIVGLLQSQVNWQAKESRYYRKDIGMSFIVEKGTKTQKVPYGVGWDFLFTFKNDSTAIVQDIKRGVQYPPKEYRISKTIDSSYVKRSLNGKVYKVEKSYYRTLYPLK